VNFNVNNPIIVQSDKTLLVEVNNVLYTEVRDKLSRFAEIIESPEYMHTYKISPLSLWNAASTNITVVRQWKQGLIDKMNIYKDDIGEYSGEIKIRTVETN